MNIKSKNNNIWKPLTVSPEDNLSPPCIKSKFKIKFPQYREKYLLAAWSEIKKILEKFGIKTNLDVVEGDILIETTKKVWDPWAIINARDFINLLTRSVPLMQAIKIFQDTIHCEIVQLGKRKIKKNIYIKRRQRILGPDGATLKALELITNCYILVQGNTCSIMGPSKGVHEVQDIIRDCMKNVHPIYKIKELMIKRELYKNKKLKNTNWDRFLPKFKKKNVKRRKPIKICKKSKEFNFFPQTQLLQKIDKKIISGEYFIHKKNKLRKTKKEFH